MEDVRIEEGGAGLKGRRCNLWVLVGLAFVVAVVGAVVVVCLYLVPYFTMEQYGVVFDAGSTHSDMTLYRWPGAKLRGTGEVIEVTRCDAEGGGISDYADEPPKAGESLRKCLDQGISKVPKHLLDVTPVYLGATAGMRLVPTPKADLVMGSVGKLFDESPLKYSDGQARIISDQEEGMFAWITANLLLEKLGQHGEKVETAGILDMGGASTQIAFETSERAANPVDADYGQLRLYGFDFPVFAHSYLCWGTKEATKRYRSILAKDQATTTVDDPCHLEGSEETINANEIFEQKCTTDDYPTGMNKNTVLKFVGIGDPEKCKKVVAKQVDMAECKAMFGGRFCYDPSVIPTIKGKFMGISSYFYTTNFLNVTDGTTLEQYRKNSNDFCRLKFDQVKSMPGQNIKFSRGFCYNTILQNHILETIYGFDNEERWKDLSFKRNIKGVTTGWTLGFMANATNSIPTEAVRAISTEVFAILLVIFLVVAIIVSIFSYRVWQRKRSRSSQITSGAREANCYGLCCPRK